MKGRVISMSILNMEKDRLKKHYLELEDNYNVLKGEVEKSLNKLTKTEVHILSKFGVFVDLYKKINCSPDFYEMDGFDATKVTLDLEGLKLQSNMVVSISKHIGEKNDKEFAGISLLGTKKLLDKSNEIGMINESSINRSNIEELKSYLDEILGSILDRKNTEFSIEKIDDDSIIEFEKEIHSAIGELKNLNHSLSTMKSICDKYDEKLNYLEKIYDHDSEIVREYVDFSGANDWKELDKNQNALMSIHSNVTVAQLLHDMCSKGIIDANSREIDYKGIEEMIEKADNVIDVIDVYLKTNVF